jgi:hypothetical protein
VAVSLSEGTSSPEIVERRRIVTMDAKRSGAKQPYHHAASMELSEAEQHIASCAATSQGLASAAIEETVGGLERSGYRVAGCAILLASGRVLPPLEKILASHPLIHTAEGEFFRNVVRTACEGLNIPVTAIRERDLDEQAKIAFGNATNTVQRSILAMGSSIGPPWTKDHKSAAIAACIILARSVLATAKV